MAMRPFTLRTDADVVAMRRSVRLRDFGHRSQVSVQLPFLDAATRSDYERSLNRLLRSCGCASGATSAFAALAIVVAFRITQAQAFSVAYILVTALLVIVAMLLAAALGKLLGLVYARRRFVGMCVDLERAIEGRASTLPASSNHSMRYRGHVDV